MNRRAILRESRVMHAAVGATILAGPASAALADSPHPGSAQAASSPTTSVLEAKLRSHRLRYGQSVLVYGRAPASEAGQAVALEFAPAGSTSWQQIAAGQIGRAGAFRLSAPLRGSGAVRVSATPGSPVAVAAAGATGSATSPQRVTVAARLQMRRRSREVLGSRVVEVHGELLPRAGRHRVLLQGRSGGRWITLAAGHTTPRGRFELRFLAHVVGQAALRVRFPGDRGNAAVSVSAGPLTVFHQAVASWYDDGGTTGCGFHAYYGVANLSLPCGARVSFSYGGRTVNAVVDDRGPYVGGREWDLNQNTAGALGFGGVGTVWSSQ